MPLHRVLLLALLATLCTAQLPEASRGHIWAQAPPSVISNTLPRESAAPLLRSIQKFFKEFAKQVDKNQKVKNDGTEEIGNVDTQTCNMQGLDWAERAELYAAERNLTKPDRDCPTRREINNDEGNGVVYPRLDKHLPEFADLLNRTSTRIARNAGKNWDNKAAGVSRFWYPDRENQNCTLWHTMGIRVDNQWYVQSRVTADNTSSATTVGSDNDYIIEHIAADDSDALRALGMRVPISKTNYSLVPASTTFEVRSRPAPDSVSVNADISRNLAFRAALAKGEDQHQQAQDATQISNTAILLLPLAMNLVPVALIADVNTFGMLLYTALTDVLTTVPLCIKGVELITIANNEFSATSAQITGSLGAGNTALAEAWVVKCRLKEHNSHRARGIVFVVLSLSLMVFGVACEFIAKWWVKHKRVDDQIPLAGGHDTYGTTTSYQPFTAAALTLQNRMPSARSPSQYRGVGGEMHTAAAVAAGTPMHQHAALAPSCVCACHSTHHTAANPEYHARAYPDPLDRKLH